jgi:hypothetical protein
MSQAEIDCARAEVLRAVARWLTLPTEAWGDLGGLVLPARGPASRRMGRRLGGTGARAKGGCYPGWVTGALEHTSQQGKGEGPRYE